MKKIILFDPSYGTLNMGDFIINDSILREMSYLFDESFTIRYGTHNPLLQPLQMFRPGKLKENCTQAQYKILGGTNLLKRDLMHISKGWNIDLLTSSLYSGSVSMGCGIDGSDSGKTNLYTRKIYERALSKTMVHSVRDEPSKKFLERLGFKAYNTGCPTLWGFDAELNESIPKKKAKNVIFTLTDYHPDIRNDQKLIDILKENYEAVYFWIQGSGDYKYLQRFSGTEDFKLINPNLEAYRKVLLSGDVDYVGTRLHAGIFAMQHKVRSVILAIDNRARDMDATHNLNTLERSAIDQLGSVVNSNIDTNVTVNRGLINIWKEQFEI